MTARPHSAALEYDNSLPDNGTRDNTKNPIIALWLV